MTDVLLSRPRVLGRRLAGGTSVLAMLLFVAGVVAPAAGAARPAEYGYWWRLQSTLGPALSAPGVPEGGLWVMADPSGDQAVSALRIVPDPGETILSLTLPVAEQVGTPTIVVCPTVDDWEPVDGGDWETRPDADCSAQREAVTFDEAAETMIVPLEAFGSGQVDVMLVPEPATDGFFSVSFEAPDDGSIEVAPGASPPAGSNPFPHTPAAAGSSPTPTVAPRMGVGESYRPPPAGFAVPEYDDAPSPSSRVPSPSPRASSASPQVPLAASTSPIEGARHPAALLSLALVAGAWWYRLRASVAAAADHPLSAANIAFGREMGTS